LVLLLFVALLVPVALLGFVSGKEMAFPEYPLFETMMEKIKINAHPSLSI
jgi:hypothetical protein